MRIRSRLPCLFGMEHRRRASDKLVMLDKSTWDSIQRMVSYIHRLFARLSSPALCIQVLGGAMVVEDQTVANGKRPRFGTRSMSPYFLGYGEHKFTR